jgi:5-formyltetrahydrofolate cyclo-ligase
MGPLLVEKQKQLTQNLVEFLKKEQGLWCGYNALPDEASVSIAINQSAHLVWAFPKVSGQDLSFWTPKHLTSFLDGAFGIKEPSESESKPVRLDQIRGLLIPGQAFDQSGQRLGRGKSFYDRALQQFNGRKVGVCFSSRWSQTPLPQDPWDRAMDIVITEEAVIQCSSR